MAWYFRAAFRFMYSIRENSTYRRNHDLWEETAPRHRDEREEEGLRGHKIIQKSPLLKLSKAFFFCLLCFLLPLLLSSLCQFECAVAITFVPCFSLFILRPFYFLPGFFQQKKLPHARTHAHTCTNTSGKGKKRMRSFRSVIFPVDLGFRMFAEILRSQNEMGILSLP